MTSDTEKVWLCTVCGYIHRGPAPPEVCPVCGASVSEFEEQPEPEPQPSKKRVTRWRCTVCDHIHEGDEPPEECPVCGATADCFEPVKEEAEAAAETTEAAGKVVIVGAGIAGLSAAEAVRDGAPDAEIVLLSREEHLPYYRLNLTRFLAGELGEDDLPVHPKGWYEKKKIDLRLGVEVKEIHPEAHTVSLSDGSEESYDKLILTAGAHAFRPPLKGAERQGVTCFRTCDDAKEILDAAGSGARFVCIGGGILGMETVGALAKKGCDVSLVESYSWLMPRQLSKRGGKLLQENIESLGVKILMEARVAEIQGNGKAKSVRLEDDRVADADVVILTTGVRSNTHLARRAGLEVNRGVLVDSLLRTSDPDIFAAGDIAEYDGICYGLWPASQYQGTIAGMNASGQKTEFGGIPRSNTLKVVGLDVFSIGQIEPEDGSYLVLEKDEPGEYTRFLFHDNRMVGAQLVGNTSLAAPVKKVIENEIDLSGALGDGRSVDKVAEALSR